MPHCPLAYGTKLTPSLAALVKAWVTSPVTCMDETKFLITISPVTNWPAASVPEAESTRPTSDLLKTAAPAVTVTQADPEGGHVPVLAPGVRAAAGFL